LSFDIWHFINPLYFILDFSSPFYHNIKKLLKGGFL